MTLTYASLFSAAGIGCHGFHLEGFDCVATAELDPRRLEVQRHNNVCSDPTGYHNADLSDSLRLDELITEVKHKAPDLTAVIATPPCQGMSVANRKRKSEQEERGRNSLVVHSVHFIKQTRPQFFILENVPAFLTTLCTVDGEEKPIGEMIRQKLDDDYFIVMKKLNLKDHGSPSSRPRTLVIGTRRDMNIDPEQLFPKENPAPTLRELIGDLPALDDMGEITDSDIFHAFRPYRPDMRAWIKDVPQGQTAFDNPEPHLRPHRIVDGEIVEHVSTFGNKYYRNIWDKVAPCVLTRNDILSCQRTIHPKDDRVFSIREVCRMMGVGPDFRWTDKSLAELNALPEEEKTAFLKKNGAFIRACLGEAVPTPVLRSVAVSIKKELDTNPQ